MPNHTQHFRGYDRAKFDVTIPWTLERAAMDRRREWQTADRLLANLKFI